MQPRPRPPKSFLMHICCQATQAIFLPPTVPPHKKVLISFSNFSIIVSGALNIAIQYTGMEPNTAFSKISLPLSEMHLAFLDRAFLLSLSTRGAQKSNLLG